jgi:hypothetical protein
LWAQGNIRGILFHSPSVQNVLKRKEPALNWIIYYINPLKDNGYYIKHEFYLNNTEIFSSYLIEDTLPLHYKDQPINAVYAIADPVDQRKKRIKEQATFLKVDNSYFTFLSKHITYRSSFKYRAVEIKSMWFAEHCRMLFHLCMPETSALYYRPA